MKGTTNMSGVREQGKFTLPPEGTYEVEIAEKKDGQSSNDDPMISIKLVICAGEYQDEAWIWDNILIPSLDSPAAKILGRTKHFLHCIGEPYEEEETLWDSDKWVWKRCKVRLVHEAPNAYHKFPKAIVAEYILNEEVVQPEQEDSPFN
jgi:hypothetical protein